MPLPAIPVPLGVARAALRVRQRLLNVVDAGVPAEVALFDLAWGMQRTKLAGALVTSGLADASDGTRDPAALASRLGLDADVTCRVIDAAVGARLMRLDRAGRVFMTRVGGPLRSDHPDSIASWIAYQAAPARSSASSHLDAQLRNGAQPSGHRRVFGGSVWDYFGEHSDEGAVFGRAMRELTAIDLAPLVRAYPWPKRGVICDVSGGVGTLLAAILRRNPSARGILIEDSDVIVEAEAFLEARVVADRVERRVGDLFGHLDAQADTYILKWILHDWSDDACRDILKRVRATMARGARLVVIDQHREAKRPNSATSMTDLHMLIVCEGGRERSPDEVHALMRDAGLRPGKVRHAGVQMLVEGVAA